MIKVLYSSGSDFRFKALNGDCLLAHHGGEQEGRMVQTVNAELKPGRKDDWKTG